MLRLQKACVFSTFALGKITDGRECPLTLTHVYCFLLPCHKAAIVMLLHYVVGIAVLLAFVDASLASQKAKAGERVEVDLGKTDTLVRNVDAGRQTFHFQGKDAGFFVTDDGKRVKSNNYEAKNGVLVIKKATRADKGTYEKGDNLVKTVHADGSISAVLGPVLQLQVE
ncbi:unnamed protein product [Caenorhabditis auriculariae]|uniref:Uncharacterized protein n=1 Tax=Caenorhabditis auriculariae TaxID=2777116 RepID=A0A8S1HBM5_9PELO|nr:unnamed protein product [Caenorhabditis auriculariae]